ncbi:MAG TPA: DUF2252 family protein [Gemmatimonadales bacterium]|nr:DUF2252 family protein [Gemmatimonadales bacterium]
MAEPPDIVTATRRYEGWVSTRVPLIKKDLSAKHAAMRAGVFPFLRATFYRWAERWRDVVGEAARGPRVVAVGDLHVDNFGTWRDVEGRLIWGVNDFDETWRLPYSNDLIRLATSAMLAVDSRELEVAPKRGAALILGGYRAALAHGGRAFVFAERHNAMRRMAAHRLHDPQAYWQKLDALPSVRPPADVVAALERALPERGLAPRFVHRLAGVGSLGRQRFLALAEWRGGRVAREAKALQPSACALIDRASETKIAQAGALRRRVWMTSHSPGARCPDPYVSFDGLWLIRRLAPDCSRIPLNLLPKQRDAERLLHAMGWEAANVHVGSARAAVLEADLRRRPKRWLYEAAMQMAEDVERDWKEWVRRG